MYPHKGKFYALDRNLDPKTGSIRYEVTFPNPGNHLAARPVRESALRRRNEERRDGHPAGSRNRVAGQLSGRGGRPRQQGQHASGKDGRAHRRDVGSD